MTPADARQEAIVDATRALLEDGRSFAELRVDEITDRADIGRSNFYFHFRDKRDLLLHLADLAASDLYRRADLWWHGPPEMQADFVPLVALFIEHGSVLSAVAEAAAADIEVRRRWRGLVDRFVAATGERIERERAAGAAPADLPVRETAYALVWMTERTCLAHLHDALSDPADIAVALAGVWQRAIYAPAP